MDRSPTPQAKIMSAAIVGIVASMRPTPLFHYGQSTDLAMQAEDWRKPLEIRCWTAIRSFLVARDPAKFERAIESYADAVARRVAGKTLLFLNETDLIKVADELERTAKAKAATRCAAA